MCFSLRSGNSNSTFCRSCQKDCISIANGKASVTRETCSELLLSLVGVSANNLRSLELLMSYGSYITKAPGNVILLPSDRSDCLIEPKDSYTSPFRPSGWLLGWPLEVIALSVGPARECGVFVDQWLCRKPSGTCLFTYGSFGKIPGSIFF